MTTSGAPLPAFSAVWSLVYSSWPAPALVHSILMSVWVELYRSTTFWKEGYHAHTFTVTGPEALSVPASEPLLQAARVSAVTAAAAATNDRRTLNFLTFTGSSQIRIQLIGSEEPASGAGTPGVGSFRSSLRNSLCCYAFAALQNSMHGRPNDGKG